MPDAANDRFIQRLSTRLVWDDLALSSVTQTQLDELVHLLQSGSAQQRYLFHGQPGTGKTVAATLIGAASKRDVYRVDQSALMSKYIGETEKNLSAVFDRARQSEGILLFDEADALFGKRTEVKDSHDRHANLETSQLLAHIEHHTGIAIFATNNRNQLDDAFIRRLHSTIYFPLPDADQRLRLWKRAFRNYKQIADAIDLVELSRKYELSGAVIRNIAGNFGASDFTTRKRISNRDLERYIEQELTGKTN